MRITLPVTKYTEFDLPEEATDNLLLDILYADYHTTWKQHANANLITAIKAVFHLYSGQDIDDMQVTLH